MGNIKGIILALGLLFIFLSQINNVECQNIKGLKQSIKNSKAEDEKNELDTNNIVKGESPQGSSNELKTEKKNELKEANDSPKVESIKKESAIIKENEDKTKDSNEDSKDLQGNTKEGAFIEGEKEEAQNTNTIVTKEPTNEKNGTTNEEELNKATGNTNVEATTDSMNKKAIETNSNTNSNANSNTNESEGVFAKTQTIDMDDVPMPEEPVQESNLYFLQMLAFFSSIFMQLTSIPTVFKILKKKSTGELDGLAYVMLLYSSFLWLVYGMLIENTAVVLPNFSGLTLGLIYTISYHKYCKSMWLKQKLYSYYKICGLVTFLMYIFIYFMTFEQYVLSAGLLASVSSVINFGAPLSSVREVIKKRDTASIPLEMTLGSLTCSFLWLLYGLNLRDAFLIIPNLGGFLLGLMQIVLIIIYSNKEPMQFIVDESCFKEEKDSYRPGGNFYPDGKEDYDNKISDVSTSVHESFFDFTYDETSPLTSDANFVLKQNIENNENALKSANSIEEDTVLNF